MSSKLIRGTFIITLGTILSKVLGLLYVIPFYRIIGGEEEVALYQFGYVPYTIFISIATAGVPLAVSKYIAKYNALEEYAVGRKLFRSGMYIMFATGILSFIAMYLLAPWFAGLVLNGADTTNSYSVSDVTTVIRAVSFALIIIPFMSLIRGFFQGHQSMGPSAVSTVIEQLARIIFLLAGAYIALFVLKKGVVTAVSVATFAAFIGGLASLIVLIWYWKKRKPGLDKLLQHDRGTLDIPLSSMYKEILIYALPFVLVGIANPLFQFIDQITFNRAMAAAGKSAEALGSLGILNFTTHKLVIIPVSLATAFALTLVPMVTESFVKGERRVMFRQLDQTFQVLLFITIPAAIGLALLADPMYTMFYPYDEYGAQVLRTYAPVAILFSLYAVTAAILQGINEQRYTILSLLSGLLIKLALNMPLIKMYGTEGAVYATALGYTFSIVINLIVIKKFAHYPFKLVAKRTLLIIIFNVIMAIPVYFVYKGLLNFLSPESTFQAIIIVGICATIGGFIYAYLGLRSGLADRLFGTRLQRLKKRLRLS
ncbi:putative polysaccharide biosynthesis protein [Lederbergia lenta]|uniref:Polysaccharide biosynthesis protein n=1 Tax=Lederbergia lenta TaxID=1467 RepID=A0A2X4WDX8_LEDLE|nr:polysaccharide biosynthesis protein [Lederbergia lenta]MCM3113406.1 polysaccharide biosynthesis protein [Lederbergia lenta]MEC2326449.1 polysaccharide biosynthesis protein [Lederbergia lenta]SQI61243.1 polysaccharide biosynthesis protein [Lederbergia lenta]